MRIQLESLRFDASLAHGLAHPFRVDLLEALQGGEASHLELCEQIAAHRVDGPNSPEYVLYHLKVLESTGCVERVRTISDGADRAVFFRAIPETFLGGQEWNKVPGSLLATVQAKSVETFAAELRAVLEAGGVAPVDGTLTWSAITVDAQGAREAQMILRAARLRLIGVHRSAVKRRDAREGRATTMIVGLAGFCSARSTEALREP